MGVSGLFQNVCKTPWIKACSLVTYLLIDWFLFILKSTVVVSRGKKTPQKQIIGLTVHKGIFAPS